MFIVLKKKTLIFVAVALIAAIACAIAGGIYRGKPEPVSITRKTVVLDAGHGGADKGVVGPNGTEEATKNLEISYMLKSMLEDSGFYVVMTRTKDSGADEVGGFKREDFARRKRVIEAASPDIVVSVHCNKFPSRDRRGAQVFYNPLSEEGKKLAGSVQESLNELNSEYVGKTYTALGGEYFMLNLTEAPSIIAECGFLSNAEDEKLLCDEDYLRKLVQGLSDGINGYFN